MSKSSFDLKGRPPSPIFGDGNPFSHAHFYQVAIPSYERVRVENRSATTVLMVCGCGDAIEVVPRLVNTGGYDILKSS